MLARTLFACAIIAKIIDDIGTRVGRVFRTRAALQSRPPAPLRNARRHHRLFMTREPSSRGCRRAAVPPYRRAVPCRRSTAAMCFTGVVVSHAQIPLHSILALRYLHNYYTTSALVEVFFFSVLNFFRHALQPPPFYRTFLDVHTKSNRLRRSFFHPSIIIIPPPTV